MKWGCFHRAALFASLLLQTGHLGLGAVDDVDVDLHHGLLQRLRLPEDLVVQHEGIANGGPWYLRGDECLRALGGHLLCNSLNGQPSKTQNV